MRVLAGVLTLLFALAFGGPSRVARADSDLIAKAKAEMAQLNYDAAIALLEQAEMNGGNQPAEVVEIYRAIAESHAAMGRTDAAETNFRRVLAVDPSVELPAGSSPKLTGPFTAAREFLAKRRLAVECRRGEGNTATLVVLSDPVDLVAGARMVTADGGRVSGSESVSGQGRIALTIPANSAAAGCAALDRHGNVLARADLTDPPPEASADRAAAGAADPLVVSGGRPAEDGGSRPVYARWWLYAGLGAAAGGVALYYGLKMKQAEDDLEALNAATAEEDHDITWADALEIEDRGKGYARNANIALVATGVFAAVSGGLLVHQLVTDRRRDEGEPALGAAPMPGGAAVNLTLGF